MVSSTHDSTPITLAAPAPKDRAGWERLFRAYIDLYQVAEQRGFITYQLDLRASRRVDYPGAHPGARFLPRVTARLYYAAMAMVCVRGPLRKLAGDRGEHQLEGDTVAELLRALECSHPDVGGWILDERGRIRRHINVFVNGERGEEATAVGAGDRLEVLQAITGG
ncbi:MAG: MoaD/ThiS family protein [Solirubrobacteraceae bacterium]